jgi:hypothetical protein
MLVVSIGIRIQWFSTVSICIPKFVQRNKTLDPDGTTAQVCLESISPTFYARLFSTKVSRKTFLYLDFRFVLFWRKNIGAKAARILLVKLTPEL